MINWQHQLPTFSRWLQDLGNTQVVSEARDAWRGVNRRGVIEFGRGVRRVSLWEESPGGVRLLATRENDASTYENLLEHLVQDLTEIGLGGRSCDLVLHPPWAIVKTFALTKGEAQNPTQWIARHRIDVLTPGIEADILLRFRIHENGDQSPILIVGLARKSVIETARSSIENIGARLNEVSIGPLSALDRAGVSENLTSVIAVERSGIGSVGCWYFQDGEPLAWTEEAIDFASMSKSDDGIEAQILLSFGLSDDALSPTLVDLPTYRPTESSQSRWGFPPPVGHRAAATDILTMGVGLKNYEAWLSWSFRWCSLAASLVLALAGLAYGCALFAQTHYDADPNQLSAILEKHNRLQAEHVLAENRAAGPSSGMSESEHSRLWYDLGTCRPEGLWLRQIKSLPPGQSKRSAGWQVEGLARAREAPQLFADSLSKHYRSRLTKVEMIDPTKYKDVPASMRENLFRFAIEIQL